MNANYTSSQIADIHRKLASIKDQLGFSLPKDVDDFLCDTCATEMSEAMEKTLAIFAKKFCSDNDSELAVWTRLNEVAGSVFNEVWQFELDALRDRAPPPGVRAADEATLITAAHKAELAGLAFSGGGIRSATFNLGILQALAENKMLRDFDYLSTVSGGGYIGSWFSRWLRKADGIEAVERDLTPQPGEAGTVRESAQLTFLRRYSNFLTPQTGMFSADTWSLLAIYTRNTLLNLSILVALLAAAMMLPRLIVIEVARLGHLYPNRFALIASAAFLWAVFCMGLSISTRPKKGARDWLRGQSQSHIIVFIVIPLMIAAFAGSIALWHQQGLLIETWNSIGPDLKSPRPLWILVPGVLYFTAWSLGWWRAQHLGKKDGGVIDWPLARREWAGHFTCAISAFTVGVMLILVTLKAVSTFGIPTPALNPGIPIHLVALGMPLLLIIFGLTMVLCIGLVGRLYSEQSREWWARQGAWTMIFSLAWLGVCVMSLYGPPLAEMLLLRAQGWPEAIMASTWLGATLAGLLLGNSTSNGKKDPNPYLGWIATMAPIVFAIGLLVIVSTLSYRITVLPAEPAAAAPVATVSVAQDGAEPAPVPVMSRYYLQSREIPRERILLVLLILLAGGAILARRVDINKFSLYMMYRNRLTRAYLGASHKDRTAHPFSGFDEKDDILLSDLLTNDQQQLQRPYHILNTTLNMVSGSELAWQMRKASDFSFTPGFCGFELPSMPSPRGATASCEAARGCYRPTASYNNTSGINTEDDDGGVKLGMAMAVSGAAVNPNMGYHSSPALSFLLTLFNIRLGRWFANPLSKKWKQRSPKTGLLHLVQELFGLTDAKAGYLHLSDGGHFENLAIYELVRRRCRLIVVVDAGADGNMHFEDLGNAIRKCATDLNIQIDIDVSKVDRLQTTEFSSSYYAVGKIGYSRTDQLLPGVTPDNRPADGTLLYIKPCLLGNEHADVLNYRKSNKDFPHQTTADQWFDETQFESYRSLGYRIGMMAFKKASAAVAGAGKANRVAALCNVFDGTFGRGAKVLHVVQKRRSQRRQA